MLCKLRWGWGQPLFPVSGGKRQGRLKIRKELTSSIENDMVIGTKVETMCGASFPRQAAYIQYGPEPFQRQGPHKYWEENENYDL